MGVKRKVAAFTDRDGRVWRRQPVTGRYFTQITAPSGTKHWVDSSLTNLRREFGPLAEVSP